LARSGHKPSLVGVGGWGAGIAGFCVAKSAFADLFRQLEAHLSICAIQGK